MDDESAHNWKLPAHVVGQETGCYAHNQLQDSSRLGQGRPGGILSISPLNHVVVSKSVWTQKLTNGEGAHHVVDNVGINEIEKSLNCVAYGGTVDCIGFLGGQPKTTPNIPVLAMTRSAMIRYVWKTVSSNDHR